MPPSTSIDPATDPASVFGQVETYWRSAYPAAFGAEFADLRGGLHALDSGAATGSALCIGSPEQLSGNAYYCPDADGIVYDTGVLVPVLLDHYGRAGLMSSLAHEFGHAVAARAGVAAGPAVIRELQADCFAGNFLSSVAGLDMVAALAPLLDFGDQVSAKPTDPTAHGLAIDRAQAVQLGYRGGPSACRDIKTTSISLVLGRFPATGPPDGTFAAELPPGETGCALGSWTSAHSVRLSDPDEALNYLREQPGVTVEEVFGFLDGFAGRC